MNGTLVLKDIMAWIEQTAPEMVKSGEELLKNVGEKFPVVGQLIENVKNGFGGCIFGEQVDVLQKSDLVTFAKRYMVYGANEVIAIYRKEDDGAIVYLSYAKDRELMPEKQNHFVIVKSAELSDDVKAIFNDSEVVVLR